MSETTGVSRGGRQRWLDVGFVVVAVVVVAVVWVRDRQRDDEWAHGGDGVDVTAQIQATTPQDYPDALKAVGVQPEPAYARVSQMYVVKVSWSDAPSNGSYSFVLLDGRVTPPQPLGAAGSWDDGTGSEGRGSHWTSYYDALSEHYPWLIGTAPLTKADGSTSTDYQAVSLTPGAQGGGVLSFFLPKSEVATSHPDEDLVLAMVHMDGDGVRWARKVPLEPAAGSAG